MMGVMHEANAVRCRAAASSSTGDTRWHAVHTHTRAEEVAARNLERQGFPIFLPLRTRNVRHARRVKTIKEAYFPRYLFVSLDLDRDQWRCVKSTVGVKDILSASDRPLPVRKGYVEALISVTQSDGVLKPVQLLEPGQMIRILQGPFAEQIGVLQHVSSADSVFVLLGMMDRDVSVKLARENIRVIS